MRVQALRLYLTEQTVCNVGQKLHILISAELPAMEFFLNTDL